MIVCDCSTYVNCTPPRLILPLGDLPSVFPRGAGLPLDHVHTTLRYQALHAAVEFGHLDSARLLVAMGAKVRKGYCDVQDGVHRTVLGDCWRSSTLLRRFIYRQIHIH